MLEVTLSAQSGCADCPAGLSPFCLQIASVYSAADVLEPGTLPGSCSETMNKMKASITAEGESVTLRTDSVTLSTVGGHNHSRTPTAVVC